MTTMHAVHTSIREEFGRNHIRNINRTQLADALIYDYAYSRGRAENHPMNSKRQSELRTSAEYNSMIDTIVEAYDVDHHLRAYHTIQHALRVREVANEIINTLTFDPNDPHLSEDETVALQIATICHDVIFDDEKNSALFALIIVDHFKGGDNVKKIVIDLIMATKHDEYQDKRLTLAEKIICDADLWILSRPYNEYRAHYSALVRIEYRVSDFEYATKRIPILMRFANRQHIYHMEELYPYDDIAKENMRREISYLTSFLTQ